MPSGKKRKGHKMATHKRKKRLRKNRHKKEESYFFHLRETRHGSWFVKSKLTHPLPIKEQTEPLPPAWVRLFFLV